LKDGDSTRFFETQALLLEVATVNVNPEADIEDIKEPMEIPYTFWEAFPYILGVAGLLGIIIFIIWYIRKNKTKAPIIIEKAPEIPPHAIALQKIEALRTLQLWQKGEFKQYHSDLTDIIRAYLEDRFTIKALEQTSDEIIISCKNLSIHSNSKMMLQEMLQLADLVKFAKTTPAAIENEKSMSQAIEFIHNTILAETVTISINTKDEKHV
jgi:hypothetical protein